MNSPFVYLVRARFLLGVGRWEVKGEPGYSHLLVVETVIEPVCRHQPFAVTQRLSRIRAIRPPQRPRECFCRKYSFKPDLLDFTCFYPFSKKQIFITPKQDISRSI